ncbi:Alpha/Beta hydrolase protein [Mucor mucedo]|uniref:Alpha/Beta hydrolase protein n=1 Tax=Mucor mucedo TaxID=29922 RepID=UPI00221EE2AD|nr:Alpha/Beta hydrolase protein [Mucor mucedo]KAI7895192.1 Alpha/Beta hydrolase protein [Mucor mucedo]
MDTLISVYPIHPLYKEVCQRHAKELALMYLKAGGVATPESEYQAITEVRVAADEFAQKHPVPETCRTQQQVVGGPKNTKVNTTIFRPLQSQDKILPVILYCHGGGWVLGSAITHAKLATDLCIRSGAAVMLVEYSHSPEFKFPVANEQTYGALCWLREHGSSIHIDPEQIVIAGDSAGGNMATVVSMMAKDRGMKDAIKAQILMYPAVAADTEIYPSYKLYGNGDCYLSTKEAELCASAYIPTSLQGKLDNIYITPVLATPEQLVGLPPALILTCECDILRDEGEAYAAKLTSAGVYTVGMRVLGTIHSFMSMAIPETPQYRTSLTMIVDFMKDHLTQK